ncbi:hypothetical protein [Acidianus brierleyi]|uniref:Uncharacterized protein n=1 Tax=Acidianus brierleyi TaxID=41673 RepID=A0A2U9ICK8_9CREN|nr:hypothetical protein [Acidianus brierleyi]AWR93765.1 hypothetical protein DFR85_03180 [Acidianus brierleyi]
MFEELIKAIDYINDGNVISAGKYLIELAKNQDDEDILKVVAETEKELREIEDEKTLLDLDSKFRDQLIDVIRENIKWKKEKIRVLSLYLIDKMSKGNEILLQMIRSPTEGRPHTFI